MTAHTPMPPVGRLAAVSHWARESLEQSCAWKDEIIAGLEADVADLAGENARLRRAIAIYRQSIEDFERQNVAR